MSSAFERKVTVLTFLDDGVPTAQNVLTVCRRVGLDKVAADPDNRSCALILDVPDGVDFADVNGRVVVEETRTLNGGQLPYLPCFKP